MILPNNLHYLSALHLSPLRYIV